MSTHPYFIICYASYLSPPIALSLPNFHYPAHMHMHPAVIVFTTVIDLNNNFRISSNRHIPMQQPITRLPSPVPSPLPSPLPSSNIMTMSSPSLPVISSENPILSTEIHTKQRRICRYGAIPFQLSYGSSYSLYAQYCAGLQRSLIMFCG